MKKGSKIILGAFFLGIAALLVTGCDANKQNKKQEQQSVEEKPKGNCTVFECINQIEITDNLEKINTTIGFEGKEIKSDTGWKKYEWKISSDENVEVIFYETGKNDIKINFRNDTIKSKKVDFSGFDEMKKQITDGTEIKYNQIKESFKTDGTLVEKNNSTNIYRWVSEDDGYLNVSFSTINGRVTYVKGKY